MRNVFLVCYDVADAKRLRRTYKTMRGFGTPVQYSIFRCELSPMEKHHLEEALWEIMNWAHDRVMLIDLDALTRLELEETIEAGRNYNYRTRYNPYTHKSKAQLIKDLGNWSPVVRYRAALTLSQREGEIDPRILDLLKSDDPHALQGASMAVKLFGSRGAPAVPALRKLLDHNDLWTRILSGQSLAAIGEPARVAVPKLFQLALAKSPDDPRAYQQRYLVIALFGKNGLLATSGSLDGIDRESIRRVVRDALNNEESTARAGVSSLYQNLSYDELKPLLPVIYQATIEPAMGNVMMQNKIRIAGLQLLAKHRVKEGMDAFVYILEHQTRFNYFQAMPRTSMIPCIKEYGSAAKQILPELEAYMKELEVRVAKRKRERPGKGARWEKEELIPMKQFVKDLEAREDPPPKLRSIKDVN